MTTRAEVLAEARQWIDTPFRHQGREKGRWVDCLGVLIGVCKNTGLVGPDYDYVHYGPLPVPTIMESELDARMERVKLGAELPGDVPWMSDPILGGPPRHVGIITERGTLIHAHSTVNGSREKGRVVEQQFDAALKKRVRRYYRFRGLED